MKKRNLEDELQKLIEQNEAQKEAFQSLLEKLNERFNRDESERKKK